MLLCGVGAGGMHGMHDGGRGRGLSAVSRLVCAKRALNKMHDSVFSRSSLLCRKGRVGSGQQGVGARVCRIIVNVLLSG